MITIGLYHVLLPASGRPWTVSDPEDIRIRELLTRLENGEVQEMILATNPDIEGSNSQLHRPSQKPTTSE